jgi:methionyl-tRNA formyltransferase
MTLKVVFIGCVEFSREMLLQSLALEGIEVIGIVTRAESKSNADFFGLKPIAVNHGIDALIVSGNDQDEMARWIEQKHPDIVFCFGWSYLLQTEILKIPPLGILGYHPANLPHNRGRHPIVWALALGMKETASTFFLMDEGADSGDIVDQVKIGISLQDDARSLYSKFTASAKTQLGAIVDQWKNGEVQAFPQNSTDASYWRKRGEKDGEIDWRMSSVGIYNLVRALTKPYVGAHCIVAGEKTKVWKVEPLSTDDTDIEPGKVIDVAGGNLTVKCWGGAVVLLDHELRMLPAQGTYL